MFAYNKKPVYLGWSLADFTVAKNTLDRAGIAYETGITDSAGSYAPPGRARAHSGASSPFMPPYCDRHYTLYVHKRDFEKAHYFVGRALGGIGG